MRFSRCLRSVMRAAGVVMAVSTAVTTMAHARPRPKPGQGFRLFSSALIVIEANRVFCRVSSDGQLCATGSSTVGGGIWPKGTADQYIFAGGLQIGGIVDPSQSRSVNGFAGDTAGAFFYNTSGTSNGTALRPIFAAVDPADAAAWPVEARVPCSDPATTTIPGGLPPETIARCDSAGVGGDATGDLFDPALQGTISGSQGDHWLFYWEGDPANLASRRHPLGILVETRAMVWNFPSGNEDILYFIFTFYNVTSAQDDDYLSIRSSIRPFIQQKGKDFQALNTAKFGVNLPTAGYTIKDIFVDVVNDMDVANFNANYSGVNVPFALGYTYENDFSATAARTLGWTFDPAIFGSAPFFEGVGFAGVKYLGSPINPATNEEVGLTLFGTFSNTAGSLTDANDDKQLYRYMTGHLASTDGSCTLNPDVDKICSVNMDTPTDMRFYQSSGPFDLAPGQFGSIVAAYIFAPPVADGTCPGASCDVKAADGGDPSRLTILGDPARMAGGVNQIDRMTGLRTGPGLNVDVNADGVVDQSEMAVVPGSLLGKSLVAQSVFDTHFLLPFSPAAPPFFLVPGNNQVTVLWSPSATETTPDPFFVVAANPLKADGTINVAYDPNFRGADVEGYRIYRGRTSNPSQLTLIAQYDFSPDPATGHGIFNDFRGLVNPDANCAPELAITTSCPVAFETPAPGTAFTVSNPVDLTGAVQQVKPGDRVALASGSAQILPGKLDTAFNDITRGARIGTGVSTTLANTGIPYIFVDVGVRNSVRYFYAVTAFDINSLVSGPSSLESGRIGKAVTPVVSGSNVVSSATIESGVFGEPGVQIADSIEPTIDPATGKFSKAFPPANAASLDFVGQFAGQLFSTGGSVKARLDGIGMGDARDAVPGHYTFTALTPVDTVGFALDIDAGTGGGLTSAASAPFPAAQADPALAAKYGAVGPTILSGQVNFGLPGYQLTAGQGRGCLVDLLFENPEGSSGCMYNGPRWFAGDVETKDNPNAGMTTDGSGVVTGDLNNAGELPGVATIYVPLAYGNSDGGWRAIEASLGSVIRAADFKVYWGAPGKIDSVMDVTHQVHVPFMADSVGGGFGVLNISGSSATGSADGRPTVLTLADFSCVEPFRSGAGGTGSRAVWVCGSGAPFVLSDSAELNSVALYSGSVLNGTTAAPAANAGFILYIAGRISVIELASPATLPTNTVWTLRSYTGFVSGGQGTGGDLGTYAFTAAERPFTAIGAELQINFAVTNQVVAATKDDLSGVHTVPDPYYVRSSFESSTDQKILKFVGLPQDAIVRVYSASGVLVRILEHHAGNYDPTSGSQGSEIIWDLRNRNNQVVASGVYFYHVEAGDARRVGRFTVVNFAQ